MKITKNSLPLRNADIPESPGVYIFWAKEGAIYIGKAKNLKNRVSTYFSNKLEPKTSEMINVADSISFIKVTSELESLLLEARLIKDFQPKYNSAAKDDKHPLYILITKEEYPRVLTARKDNLGNSLDTFGPFPSSTNLRWVLKMLRRIFPYSDHKIGKRACIYSHMRLCDPCPNEIVKMNNLPGSKNKKLKIKAKRKYLRNIRFVKKILSGKIKTVRNRLVKEMEAFSKEEQFEDAKEIRKQIERLDYITQPIISEESFSENPNLADDIRTQELKDLRTILTSQIPHLTSIERIECYDVAHLAGTYPTASMITFIYGEPDKNYYRHFKIKSKKSGDDIASLQEVATRRSRYFEKWGRPDLIIVDGGKGQVAVFNKVLSVYEIPIIGIAKREETLIFPNFKELRLSRGPALYLVQRIRNEAHRFARRYHHKLVSRNLAR